MDGRGTRRPRGVSSRWEQSQSTFILVGSESFSILQRQRNEIGLGRFPQFLEARISGGVAVQPTDRRRTRKRERAKTRNPTRIGGTPADAAAEGCPFPFPLRVFVF